MTLLELLRQELPKRGGWPEGVSKISSTSSGRVFFDGQLAPQGFTLPVTSDAWNKHKHPRSYTNAVTREQYEVTGWDGTGLPPVGVECEVSVDGGRSWCTYKAINEKNGARLIEIGNFTEEFQNNNWIFRPLCTEAERAIDEMVRLSGVSIGAAKILYDAGYRK